MSQVRQLLPMPSKGDLPLPKDGLPRLSSVFDPRSVEDLNAVVPDSAPKLQTAHPPQVGPLQSDSRSIATLSPSCRGQRGTAANASANVYVVRQEEI